MGDYGYASEMSRDDIRKQKQQAKHKNSCALAHAKRKKKH